MGRILDSFVDVETLQAMMKSQGYIHISGLYADMIPDILEEISIMEATHYNEERIEQHSVYPSDSTETRVSHAMMVSDKGSFLPNVSTFKEATKILLEEQEELLLALVNEPTASTFGTRFMMNFQRYFGSSKPVAEHFDGEYLDYQKLDDYAFKLKWGLLPRYVTVITLENENDGNFQGTVLREVNVEEGTTSFVHPPSRPGDLLIFDNLRFRHSVPLLEKPRVMIGLRNFDFMPYEFSSEAREGFDIEVPDAVNPGWARQIDTGESFSIQTKFLHNGWPEQWEKIKKEGALF